MKNSLDFHLTKVNDTNVWLTDKTIYNFSPTKAGKKKETTRGMYRSHNDKRTGKLSTPQSDKYYTNNN